MLDSSSPSTLQQQPSASPSGWASAGSQLDESAVDNKVWELNNNIWWENPIDEEAVSFLKAAGVQEALRMLTDAEAKAYSAPNSMRY